MPVSVVNCSSVGLLASSSRRCRCRASSWTSSVFENVEDVVRLSRRGRPAPSILPLPPQAARKPGNGEDGAAGSAARSSELPSGQRDRVMGLVIGSPLRLVDDERGESALQLSERVAPGREARAAGLAVLVNRRRCRRRPCRDHVLGRDADVGGLPHRAGERVRRPPSLADPDLLGPDAERDVARAPAERRPGRSSPSSSRTAVGARRRCPRRRFETPRKPATNAVCGVLVELRRRRRAARSCPGSSPRSCRPSSSPPPGRA